MIFLPETYISNAHLCVVETLRYMRVSGVTYIYNLPDSRNLSNFACKHSCINNKNIKVNTIFHCNTLYIDLPVLLQCRVSSFCRRSSGNQPWGQNSQHTMQLSTWLLRLRKSHRKDLCIARSPGVKMVQCALFLRYNVIDLYLEYYI